MYLVYSLLILAFGVVASPYLAYQAIRYKKYIGSFGQRMGYLPVSFNLDGEESIWIHAVSVGEALTACGGDSKKLRKALFEFLGNALKK